ncbi:hypothetical protein LCI18_012451 [Fusarium solani-melongenae]|uniref:Uncharacterized protein n=1 Tax=Fusarium solani subsp. cucurbitae TaxID=2747967 RepID=A0ACD3ZJZ4_FUSSC|nr:hypothetical protein LCI18_012451 [Fusarium solani-melongenae]
MNSSLPLSELKACLGCASAKRACDKQKPSCQRCAERTIPCQYPTTRRYFRARPPTYAPKADTVAAITLGQRVDRTTRLQDSGRSAEHANTPTADHGPMDAMDATDATDLSPATFLNPSPATYKLWFVCLDTWTIENVGLVACRFTSGPTHGSSQHRDWTRALEGWLHQWLNEGHNPFIHKQLYLDSGFPSCLQDAWATLAAYFAMTPLNKHIVMQILEQRVDTLLQSQPHDDASLMAVPSLQTIQHLARVQALFIYQYLRLYDGCVRQRAMAENCITTLLLWCDHLWQSATLDANHDPQILNALESGDAGSVNEALASQHWKAWILSESLRRTWLVCTSMIAAYLRERDGWNECAGEIRFTACSELWDSSSSGTWAELISKRDPLFVRSLHVDELLSSVSPTEVDSFSITLMRLLITGERMDSWCSK